MTKLAGYQEQTPIVTQRCENCENGQRVQISRYGCDFVPGSHGSDSWCRHWTEKPKSPQNAQVTEASEDETWEEEQRQMFEPPGLEPIRTHFP